MNWQFHRSNGIQIPGSKLQNMQFNLVVTRFANISLLDQNQYISEMTEARRNSMEMYFSRFEPSLSSTINYLKNGPLNSDSHYLLIIEKEAELLGHFGFKVLSNDEIELDNVMRIKTGIPGLMTLKIGDFIDWIKGSTEIKRISLRVIDTNIPAISMYSALGFEVIRKYDLRSIGDGSSMHTLVPCNPEMSNTQYKMVLMSMEL
jgi:hypothetical protein